VVCPLTHSLIYQLWGSCAHLLSWASSSRGLLPPPRSLSHLPAVVLMRSPAVVGIVLSRSAPSQTLSSTSCGAHVLICCRGHPPLVVCPLPHALSHLLAVVLMCSSAVVDIVPSRSAPFPHTLSSTSRGAHAPICCRGHRPLVACSLPSHTLSSTSCGAHALICYRGHRPLEVYPLPPHTLIY